MGLPQNLVPFYEGWRFTNERLMERIERLSYDELQLRSAPQLWPIWATAAHVAGARVYWLCAIFNEAGAERTPFGDPSGDGWEDDPSHPRHSGELIAALESSWLIVEECLGRWTPQTLQHEVRRERDGEVQVHTRQSVLMRLLTHDAEHIGEISNTLGMHGLEGIDLWTGRAPVLP